MTPPQQKYKKTVIVDKQKKISHLLLVDNNNNFNKLHAMVNQLPNAQIKIIIDKNNKIIVQNETDFTTLSSALNKEKYSRHSYEIKHNRPIKVMVNGSYQSIKPENIVDKMRKRDYKLMKATSKLKYRIKTL